MAPLDISLATEWATRLNKTDLLFYILTLKPLVAYAMVYCAVGGTSELFQTVI